MNKKLLLTIGVALFLAFSTILAIYFAKGYRFNPKNKKVTETGLLVTNSLPTGASVFINDKLATATNDTLNLPPGDYRVKISKDGYIPWEKALKLEKELVTQANARLFPTMPDLRSLTSAGAANLTLSPDGEKLAFVVASASASPKNGLWILNLGNKRLGFTKETSQIAKNIPSFNLNTAKLVWSPDSRQILVWSRKNSFLLNIDKLNDLSIQPDVSARLTLILGEWEDELKSKLNEKLITLPDFMAQTATESAKNLYFSPDEEKLLYTATASATIPQNLIPPLPASNSQAQQRMIEPDKTYVYDLKEDKNFYVAENAKPAENAENAENALEQRLINIQNQYNSLAVQNIQWFPTSQHLVMVKDKKIIILEYDAANQNTIYAGPFEDFFTAPWPDGSKLIILTNLNPDSPLSANLYAIDLK